MTELLQNRYRIDQPLGMGGMGMVYRGYDQLLSRTVAIKLLSKASLGTEGKARLLSEARAAAQLNHPNIMTVYDAGETEDGPYIVMELLTGETLREHKPADLAEVGRIFRQMGAALAHAHAAGIIHRDLKPENVMRLASGEVKLMDFGLARSQGDARQTEEGVLAGTLLYMAPELLMGQPASVQSDLYAYRNNALSAGYDEHLARARVTAAIGKLAAAYQSGAAPAGAPAPTRSTQAMAFCRRTPVSPRR